VIVATDQRTTMSLRGLVLRSLVVVAAHALLLMLPVAMFATARLFEPRSQACLVILLLLSLLEPAALGGRMDPSPAPARAGVAEARLALTSSLSLLATGWLAMGASGVTYLPTSATAAAAWCWLGAILALAGVALRVGAIRELGAGFTSAIEPRGHLLSNGIYGRMRHPSELGLLLVGVGLAALGASPLAGAVVIVALVPSSAARIVLEERSLAARFGPAHASYRARVGLLG
jgi:protein-S-isoprenylcysteine O-methyltransferase Ste14